MGTAVAFSWVRMQLSSALFWHARGRGGQGRCPWPPAGRCAERGPQRKADANIYILDAVIPMKGYLS